MSLEKESIEKLMKQLNLDSNACQDALFEMLNPEANPLQAAAFLVLLRAKNETPEELALVHALKQKMVAVPTEHKVLDIVGTGGDGANTINISTGSAILAASCGIKVAKNGNRAVSSLAGSADVLEALGVVIDLSPEKISKSIDEIGIGFCFAPNFHPAMRQLRDLRKQLNVPTTFNLLGPLLNPTNPAHYLLGVFDEALLPLMSESLQAMGTERSLVVHGNGLDELSCVGPATIYEITPAEIKKSVIDPQKFGLARCQVADLQGSDAQTNAQLLLDAFSKQTNKAIADTLILNAATSLFVYGLHSSMNEAITHAKDNLHNGAALKLLKNWIEFSHD